VLHRRAVVLQLGLKILDFLSLASAYWP